MSVGTSVVPELVRTVKVGIGVRPPIGTGELDLLDLEASASVQLSYALTDFELAKIEVESSS